MVGLGIVLRNAGVAGFFSLRDGPVPGYGKSAAEVAEHLLERFGLADYRNRDAQVLPAARASSSDIALTMVAKPRSSCWMSRRAAFPPRRSSASCRWCSRRCAPRATVLFVEHDMEIVSRFAQRVLAFYDGRIIADAAPQAALGDPEVQRYVAGTRA